MTATLPPSTRRNSANMQARRRRILDEARNLLVEGGVDGLSIRRLADAANVAVRTIYSLIGPKEAVMVALYDELQSRLISRMAAGGARAPLDYVEAIAIESAAMFRQDEAYCRAAFLAIQHLDEMWPRRGTVSDLFAGGLQLMVDGFRHCIDAGVLRGNLAADELADLTLQSFRMTWMEWACGRLDFDQTLAEALHNVRIILMADATEAVRALLLERIRVSRG